MSCEYWDEEKKICGRANERLVLPSDVNIDEAIRNEEFKVIRFADVPEPKIENRWIPVTERLPEKSGLYLVSTGDLVTTLSFCGHSFRTHFADEYGVDAWMPLPEPWKGDEE